MQKIPPKGGAAQFCIKKEGFPAFCCRKSFSFLFFKNTATHPPQTVRRTVLRGGGSCPVWRSNTIFRRSVSILLRRSRLRQCNISARCRLHSGAGSGKPIRFWPSGLRLRYRTSSPHRFWSRWRLPVFHFLEEFGFLGEVIIELVEGQLLCKRLFT